MHHPRTSRLILRCVACVALLGAFAAKADNFSLSSPSFTDQKALSSLHVFNDFGCNGANQSPELHWRNAPAGTQSFAITLYDPDAPTGSGWWHWVVYNIPASVNDLAQNAGGRNSPTLPAGAVQVRTDYGQASFGGACPPAGDKPHRYQLTVHALKVKQLELPADASPALVGFYLNMNRLGSATLEARYGR